MKKALLPLIIASLVPASAFADVTVYGKAFISFQSADLENYTAGHSGSYTELRNNASRLGVKGSEVINDDLKAIYQYEFEVEPDNGNTTVFKQRNIFVGLQGNFGTVTAGQFDTPLKLAQEKTDVFKDMQGDWKLVLPGEIRTPNVVQYSTPAIKNITGNIAYVSSEGDAAYQIKDGYSASIVYNTKVFYVALASDHNVQNAIDKKVAPATPVGLSTITPFSSDIYRLVARYTVGPVVLGAMYETASQGVLDVNGKFIHNSGYNFSAIYNLDDKWALKAQYSPSDMLNVKQTTKVGLWDSYKAVDEQLTSIGVDYALNKKTKLHAYYTALSDDNTSLNKDGSKNKTAQHDDSWVGVGMEISF